MNLPTAAPKQRRRLRNCVNCIGTQITQLQLVCAIRELTSTAAIDLDDRIPRTVLD